MPLCLVLTGVYSIDIEVAGEVSLETPVEVELFMPAGDIEDDRQAFIKVQCCSLSMLIIITSESLGLAPNLV